MVILLTVVAVIGLLFAAGNRAKARLKVAYPASGQLIDLGGYRLHANIEGEGDFTVIFDSGIGGTAVQWENVQAEVARNAVTVAYDRAGLGWSESSTQPRSFERMAEELKIASSRD